MPDWHLRNSALTYLTSGFLENGDMLFAITVVVFVCRSRFLGLALSLRLDLGLGLRTQGYFVLWDRGLLWGCTLAWGRFCSRLILSFRRTLNRICNHVYLPFVLSIGWPERNFRP